jgi:hypothetical protein
MSVDVVYVTERILKLVYEISKSGWPIMKRYIAAELCCVENFRMYRTWKGYAQQFEIFTGV